MAAPGYIVRVIDYTATDKEGGYDPLMEQFVFSPTWADAMLAAEIQSRALETQYGIKMVMKPAGWVGPASGFIYSEHLEFAPERGVDTTTQMVIIHALRTYFSLPAPPPVKVPKKVVFLNPEEEEDEDWGHGRDGCICYTYHLYPYETDPNCPNGRREARADPDDDAHGPVQIPWSELSRTERNCCYCEEDDGEDEDGTGTLVAEKED
jgi:hypothetical protein